MTVDAILDALKSVQDPDLHRDIVTLGFVKNVVVDGSSASFDVELTTPACPVKDILKQEAEDAVRALGFAEVEVNMTARVRENVSPMDLLPHVKHCIAIASGKGGVGKSTVSANLAIALAQSGARVGILDADVYGPSIPMLLGCQNERPLTANNHILPIDRYGVRTMSIGYMLEPGQAVLWRGPMVAGTVKQLLADVEWGELDYLLVDLPPGTGDAPMSLAQLVPLSGVVLVATPDQVAANIAAMSLTLFQKLSAPILGVVENMAYFVCSGCGTKTRIFAGLGGEELAELHQVPFLGSVPLNPRVGSATHIGSPVTISEPQSDEADAFRQIASKLAAQVSIRAVGG